MVARDAQEARSRSRPGIEGRCGFRAFGSGSSSSRAVALRGSRSRGVRAGTRKSEVEAGARGAASTSVGTGIPRLITVIIIPLRLLVSFSRSAPGTSVTIRRTGSARHATPGVVRDFSAEFGGFLACAKDFRVFVGEAAAALS